MIEVDLNHGNSESTAVFVVDLGTPRVLLDCRQLLHAIYNIALDGIYYVNYTTRDAFLFRYTSNYIFRKC